MPHGRRLPAILPEVSGLAYLPDGRLAAVNDGGHPPDVYAIDLRDGGLDTLTRGRDGNRDWEAIAVGADGSRLVVCDVGDNRRARPHVDLYAYDLPDPQRRTRTRLTYPGGARDCEACLVRGDTVTLISKAPALNGARDRTAYVYRARLGPEATLVLVDSFTLRRRSVTDAAYLRGDTLALLTYDFRLIGPIPLSKTTVYVGTLADFRQNRVRRRSVRAPFTWTQYEALAYPGRGDHVVIASERTVIWPQRWRRVRLPDR